MGELSSKSLNWQLGVVNVAGTNLGQSRGRFAEPSHSGSEPVTQILGYRKYIVRMIVSGIFLRIVLCISPALIFTSLFPPSFSYVHQLTKYDPLKFVNF
jgi:hypothetical protein